VRNDAEGVNIERMRIDSSGNVGINTTSPDEKLHITNAATFAGLKVSTTNSTTRAMIELNGKDGSGNEVELRLGGFGDTGRGEIFTVTNHAIGFATNNAAAQFKMNTNGNFQIVDGNLTVANGHGVDFSATADSGGTVATNGELLDDYEHGSWIPDIFNAGQSSNWTAKDGNYIKVGNRVTVWMRCDGGTAPRSGASGGHLTITGLPFAISGMDSNTILGIGGGNFISSGSIDVNISTSGSGNPFIRRGGNNYAEQCNYFSACFHYNVS
jgi:hypothetical protein